MSLWADYHKERLLRDTIEKDYGFLSYAIRGRELYISDLYIKPDVRQSKLGSELVDEAFKVADKEDCAFVSCIVVLDTIDPDLSLLSALRYGFKLHRAENNIITLRKEV